MTQERGQLITLEGIEGVGKSTVLKFVVKTLADQLNGPVVQTREPGGTPLAERIRDLALKTTDETVHADTELLLMFASRAQHVQEVILPALSRGDWVVSDRYVDASYAYQCGGRGLDMKKIATLEKLVAGDLKPSLVIILDAPVEVGMARAKKRKAEDRIEREKAAFFERVRATYLERAKADPSRYAIVDASLNVEEVEAQIKQVIVAFCQKQREHV